jgi:acetolactate synthase-1/2/3 large subunit
MYTTSTAFLEALTEAGVSYIFANFGSDHPALLEAISEARAKGWKHPGIITCPNEMVALSAAHGYAQRTGEPQAVLVHVDVGTQALAGAVHNVDKNRAPVLIFAGLSPYTQDGRLTGSRNEFIHWLQDAYDQAGIVRGFIRYENEIRTGAHVKQLVFRALQIARSDPKGPVYLTAAREVMEEKAPKTTLDPAYWQPIAPAALADADAALIAGALGKAKNPLIVTTYLGRNTAAVASLTRLCRRVAIGVLESVPSHVNFPASDPLHRGVQWNEAKQNPALAEADVVLVIDSDVPWIPTVSRPPASATVFHIDVDPLKQRMPLWYIDATRSFRADADTAIRQIEGQLDGIRISAAAVKRRARRYAAEHKAATGVRREREKTPMRDGGIAPEFLFAAVRELIDEKTVVLSEGITNFGFISAHLEMSRPGSLFTAGAGSLGWSGGAAIGMKLAAPGDTFIAITGDGSYLFSQPSTVFWMARRYETPFLQIVLNNRGWAAPRFSALQVHPRGYVSKANRLDIEFDPPPDHAAIAVAAGGAHGATVKQPEELRTALEEALRVVKKEKRAAVVDVWLAHL